MKQPETSPSSPSPVSSTSGAERAEDQVGLIVEVMTGAVADRAAFVGALRDGRLDFQRIDLVERLTQHHGDTAIVVGRTEMSGSTGAGAWPARRERGSALPKRPLMKRRLVLDPVPTALAVIAAGCGRGSPSGTTGPACGAARPASKGTAAMLATGHTKLGTVVVNGRGRTLYLFEKDKGTARSCYGACASIWPPVTTGAKSVAGAGPSAASLGSAKRTDGKTQVTYAGHPLYSYAGDSKPRATTGYRGRPTGGRCRDHVIARRRDLDPIWTTATTTGSPTDARGGGSDEVVA